MKPWFTLYFGIFSVMALSNAIVPILPAYAGSSGMQGTIYAAYFLGAFVSTLPAGLLADRFGRVPLIRTGLVISAASGLLLFMITVPFPVIAVRFLEGLGGGCFVAAAMAYVNTDPDHVRMSGYFMALLNAGLVTGLVLAGWSGAHLPDPATGILLFAVCTIIPACTGFLIHESPHKSVTPDPALFLSIIRDYRWLLYASVILLGSTGVVVSLYPRFSGAAPDLAGAWIAGMSIATIVAVLVAPRYHLSPILLIRWSAVLMAAGVMVTFVSPGGFVIIGALAGIVTIALMAVLSHAKNNQGMAMGLFSTMSYLGMAVLPFTAGLVADTAGFFIAFCLTAVCAGTVAITIGRCSCH